MFFHNKRVVLLLIFGLAFFAATVSYQWLLVELRFVQSESDRQFERKLYADLIPYVPVKVSDIHRGDWSEVCILYVSGWPDLEMKKYSWQLEDNFYLSRKFEVPFFPAKFGEGIWWIFFVNNNGFIVDLYRMGRSVGPTFYEGSIYEKEVPEFFKHLDLNKFSLLGPADSCASNDRAYLMQTHDYDLYKKSKAFVLISKK